MDLPKMLEKCRRDQWNVGDLDWSKKPRPLSREDETAIVQYFTDMVLIERLAGELFREQHRRATDPVLKEIFATFIKDEVRHAHAAQMLADHYDVHHYRAYEASESLRKFYPHFIDAVRHLPDEIANAYITGGELILDIALLRSINDYVHDEMSAQAMELINRDESRHIAIDYYMSEYYASAEFVALAAKRPKASAKDQAAALVRFFRMIYRVKPFFQDVFFSPMSRVDPSGRRLKEALKRFQLLGRRVDDKELRAFGRFMRTVQDLHNHPLIGAMFGRILARIAGVRPEFIRELYSDAELKRARAMTYAALAEEALAAKSVA